MSAVPKNEPSASLYFQVNFMRLQRYCKKLRTEGKIASVGYASRRAVFTKEQKDLLVTYILKAAKIYHCRTPSDIRSFAYDYAKANEIKCPDSLSANECTGFDWFSKFMNRNSNHSIRTPESTNLSRTTSFNRTNANKFFGNLTELLDCYKSEGHDIYNCDETSVTTVQRPDRIVAEKGVKQVGTTTSVERGTLVTICLPVNASGYATPPILVFPRVHFHEYFILNGPTDCCGSANPSGWMNEADFLKMSGTLREAHSLQQRASSPVATLQPQLPYLVGYHLFLPRQWYCSAIIPHTQLT
ncbi:uncharacterized protein LOC106879946 [Octopus bimaculoides]|uniref:uncharacterized protein LOC106879946 n=1 Tax=Octopus bimaculoides TaxID=37653 RepID=UPI00071D12DF|nr:uncharacterized protein LOC106879946 [Octopus bimaculoides]|eukprot:XP_014785193.1 PREDICTED: uncharacterized protein LOC106879946 [Octopus bimaculoides]